MPIKTTPHTQRIVDDAMTTAKQADDEHIKKPAIASMEQATQRMKAMRENRSSTASTVPSTAMDTIHSIQAAIGALQQSINAAVADMANATTPDEAKKAQQRLAALLRSCRKIKVKRLFFVFADRHDHPWRKRLDPAEFNLGRGDRALVKGGRIHPRYRIVVPEEFVATGAGDGA